jgi:hypothetical protein
MTGREQLGVGLMALIDTSRVQAKLLAENATAVLAFDDAKVARELLQSLRNSPDDGHRDDGQRCAQRDEVDAPQADAEGDTRRH